MAERIGMRITVVAAIALLAASLTSSAGARRLGLDRPASTTAQACEASGGAYDGHAWRAPEDAFAGFSCTVVTFDGPAALSNLAPTLRSTISDACSRSAGTFITIATFTYVGYGCIWAR